MVVESKVEALEAEAVKLTMLAQLGRRPRRWLTSLRSRVS